MRTIGLIFILLLPLTSFVFFTSSDDIKNSKKILDELNNAQFSQAVSLIKKLDGDEVRIIYPMDRGYDDYSKQELISQTETLEAEYKELKNSCRSYITSEDRIRSADNCIIGGLKQRLKNKNINNKFISPLILASLERALVNEMKKDYKEAKSNQYKLGLKKAAKRKALKETFAKSSKGIAIEICNQQMLFNLSAKAIKEEKEGAKYSGIVDKSRLYDLGQDMAARKRIIASYQEDFKKKTGKKYDLEKCKN